MQVCHASSADLNTCNKFQESFRYCSNYTNFHWKRGSDVIIFVYAIQVRLILSQITYGILNSSLSRISRSLMWCDTLPTWYCLSHCLTSTNRVDILHLFWALTSLCTMSHSVPFRLEFPDMVRDNNPSLVILVICGTYLRWVLPPSPS